MIFNGNVSLVSFGDLLDVYHKLRQKEFGNILSKFSFSGNKRVAAKWNYHQSASDFWVIPEIKQEWNRKVSGNPDLAYEDHVSQKYFEGKQGIRILSVGCGDGGHEREFAKHGFTGHIVGVDLSAERVKRAKQHAKEQGFDIEYRAGDFFKMDFDKGYFDMVLFSASLHHFADISGFLKKHIKPLMKQGGLLVVFEYSGPNRLQWRKSQLSEANRLLGTIPEDYKTLYDGKTIKKKVYRPGLLRMLAVDPSEAPDSDGLVQGIHDNFTVVEEVKLGWNVLHILLKGIAHNFVNNKPETKALLERLIQEENDFVERTGENDAVFGVYRKE